MRGSSGAAIVATLTSGETEVQYGADVSDASDAALALPRPLLLLILPLYPETLLDHASTSGERSVAEDTGDMLGLMTELLLLHHVAETRRSRFASQFSLAADAAVAAGELGGFFCAGDCSTACSSGEKGEEMGKK